MRIWILLAAVLMIFYLIGAYLSGGTIGLVYFFAYVLAHPLSMTIRSAYSLFLVFYIIAAILLLFIGLLTGGSK